VNRRRRSQSNISLFAFQDVMASVIGVLFFVVLLLALSITRDKSASASVKADDSHKSVERLRQQVETLKRQIELVERQIKQMSEKLSLAAENETEVLSEVKQKHNQLTRLYALIERDQVVLDALREEIEQASNQVRQKLDELEKLNTRIADLKGKLKEFQDLARITFIVDETDPKQPWLVEISNERFRIGTKDGINCALEFTAKDYAQRESQFLHWVPSQDSATHYFVLLIKPSALKEAYKLAEKLKDKGFDIGTDLFPEHWAAF